MNNKLEKKFSRLYYGGNSLSIVNTCTCKKLNIEIEQSGHCPGDIGKEYYILFRGITI